MRSPDLQQTPTTQDEIQENKSNGYGYWMSLPPEPSSLEEISSEIAKFSDYTEMPDIVSELVRSRTLLLEGAPGSGKSHLVRDLQTASVLYSLPAFCLALHVNSGHREGIARIKPELETFSQATSEMVG